MTDTREKILSDELKSRFCQLDGIKSRQVLLLFVWNMADEGMPFETAFGLALDTVERLNWLQKWVDNRQKPC